MQRILTKGKVVEGAKRGRELGFPTANIELTKEQANALPPIGIYAVWVKGKNHGLDIAHKGAASWGFNPTFGLEKPQLEVHILDFNEMIYGEDLEVEFVEFIRGEIKFESLENLIQHIADDCAKCDKLLEVNAPQIL